MTAAEVSTTQGVGLSLLLGPESYSLDRERASAPEECPFSKILENGHDLRFVDATTATSGRARCLLISSKKGEGGGGHPA